jgi:hypothetical protein
MREDLDFDEAAELVQLMRAAIKEECEKESGIAEHQGASDARATARRGAWKV